MAATAGPSGSQSSGGRPDRSVDLGPGPRRARELTIAPGDLVEVAATVGEALDVYDEARDHRGDVRRLALLSPRIWLVHRAG